MSDTFKKTRIIFEAIVNPLVLRFKPDEDAGRLAVTRDYDFLPLCFAKEARKIVLYLRKRDMLHCSSPRRRRVT